MGEGKTISRYQPAAEVAGLGAGVLTVTSRTQSATAFRRFSERWEIPGLSWGEVSSRKGRFGSGRFWKGLLSAQY